jgi:hypothetical protein
LFGAESGEEELEFLGEGASEKHGEADEKLAEVDDAAFILIENAEDVLVPFFIEEHHRAFWSVSVGAVELFLYKVGGGGIFNTISETNTSFVTPYLNNLILLICSISVSFMSSSESVRLSCS